MYCIQHHPCKEESWLKHPKFIIRIHPHSMTTRTATRTQKRFRNVDEVLGELCDYARKNPEADLKTIKKRCLKNDKFLDPRDYVLATCELDISAGCGTYAKQEVVDNVEWREFQTHIVKPGKEIDLGEVADKTFESATWKDLEALVVEGKKDPVLFSLAVPVHGYQLPAGYGPVRRALEHLEEEDKQEEDEEDEDDEDEEEDEEDEDDEDEEEDEEEEEEEEEEAEPPKEPVCEAKKAE